MLNAECSLLGRCECQDGFFQEGDNCLPLLGPDQQCAEDLQCVEFATCSADDTGVKTCVCMEGFYPKDGACHPRKLPMEKCSGACSGNDDNGSITRVP